MLSSLSNKGKKLKSITSINVENIKDIIEAKNIIKKAQEEILVLRKINKRKAMQHYRIQKKMKNHTHVLRHLKNKKFISATVLDQLSVSSKK